MTKAEIIAEIYAFYGAVGTEYLVVSSDEHKAGYINSYTIPVYEFGVSEVNKKPVLRQKNIDFFVVDEGEVGVEAAYYAIEEPINEINSDITGNNTLASIHKMYLSESIRGRVQACTAKSAQDILNESMPQSLLTVNANSGQKNVTVAAGFIFWVGKKVILSDNNNSEELTIDSISNNVITMTTNLINSYTTAASGVVTYFDNNERMQWAGNVLLNPDIYTLCMTSLVSIDSTIQAAGGLCTDNQIKVVVDSFINKVAVASYM